MLLRLFFSGDIHTRVAGGRVSGHLHGRRTHQGIQLSYHDGGKAHAAACMLLSKTIHMQRVRFFFEQLKDHPAYSQIFQKTLNKEISNKVCFF